MTLISQDDHLTAEAWAASGLARYIQIKIDENTI